MGVGVWGVVVVYKKLERKDKKKRERETDKMTAREGEAERGKEGVASSSPGIKSR